MKTDQLQRIGGKAMTILAKGLDTLLDEMAEGKQLKVREIKEVFEIVQGFHKMLRLEEGEATEIIARTEQPLPRNLMEAIKNDPFADAIITTAKPVEE